MITFLTLLGTWTSWLSLHWLAIFVGAGFAFLYCKAFGKDKRGHPSDFVAVVSTLVFAIPLIGGSASDMFNRIQYMQQHAVSSESVTRAALNYVYLWGFGVPALLTLIPCLVAYLMRKKFVIPFPAWIICILFISIYFAFQNVAISQMPLSKSNSLLTLDEMLKPANTTAGSDSKNGWTSEQKNQIETQCFSDFSKKNPKLNQGDVQKYCKCLFSYVYSRWSYEELARNELAITKEMALNETVIRCQVKAFPNLFNE